MTTSEPSPVNPPPSPDCLVITGDGLRQLTPDRFAMLNEMLGGIGLRANLSHEQGVDSIEKSDPAKLAAEINAGESAFNLAYSVLQQGGSQIADDAKTTLVTLETSWWQSLVDARAEREPELLLGAAQYLIEEYQEEYAVWVVGSVMTSCARRGLLDIAGTAVEQWVQFIAQNSDTKESLSAYLHDKAIPDIEEFVWSGRSDLEPLLLRLRNLHRTTR